MCVSADYDCVKLKSHFRSAGSEVEGFKVGDLMVEVLTLV